ncbi:haloacid dehalogenase type II [Rhodoglobus aureus]|uniref:Haloacid dehalogenase type II n=1 Tax=Rhodoglobus aureus TaxID=191497 RepID=A0ABP4G0E4_9MICO
MSGRALTIFFDVNETLSNLEPVADVFEEIGAGRPVAATWFNTILRDGFALTTAGSTALFGEIAATSARDTLRGLHLNGSLKDSVDAVLHAFSHVQLHADVAEGIRNLHNAGHRLFTLSNGPTTTAKRLLETAGISSLVTDLLSVEGHSPWKPARAAYEDALARTGTDGIAYLVAVHPWDIHGATEAGLSTVWINRTAATYPEHFHPPTVTVSNLRELAAYLGD